MDALAGTGIGLGAVVGCRLSVWDVQTTMTSVAWSSPNRQVSRSIRATSSKTSAVLDFETGADAIARFAGDDPLAKFVTQIISIKPLFGLLKIGAKNVMLRSAEKNGIAWKEMVEEMKASDVFGEKEKLENTAVAYPDYYTKPFHAYETGNLSWEAAFDVEPATMVIYKRTFPTVESWEKSGEMFRGGWIEAIQRHHTEFSNGLPVRDILDMGCSTASSTRFLANHYNTAQATGLDLSPYYLAVAQYIEKQDSASVASRRKSIRFLHAAAENTNLPSKCFDIVSIAFLFHECPRYASINILKEAHRLLRPGGTIAITDLSVKSKIIQNLHPALFTMMKSTEPWLDEFFRLDLEAELENCGFTNVRSFLTDPRHFTCTGTVAM